MRVAHLIITYTNPEQTERMIRRMQHPDFDFYVHVDAKLPISSHKALATIPNVYLIKKRIKVQWAAFSTMQAIFNSLQEILDSARSYDFISLMSGQDYPIKSPQYMQAFFAERRGKLLLKYRSFEGDWEEGFDRINKYHLTDYHFRGQYRLQALINDFVKRVIPPFSFYGSSMFWAISPEAAEYVLEKVDRNAAMKRFFKFTWGPDEFLVQTILMNSPFAAEILNENCHYYEHAPKTPSPKTFTTDDFSNIISSDRIYARKFDIAKDSFILDKIDQQVSEPIQMLTEAEWVAKIS